MTWIESQILRWVPASAGMSEWFRQNRFMLTKHPDQPMQRLGGDFVILNHGDADIVAAGIAAVVLLAGEITARHNAQARLAPQLQRRRFAAALRRYVEPQEKAAGRPR
jgi:hypothetical protein